jgi:phosphoribosylanthranilate isomerase
MDPTSNPRVKICCISSVEEAQMAVDFGVSALGLVSDMPSGPGVIPEERIAEIASIIPPGVSSFLLTSKTDAPSIINQQRRVRVNTIQLVDTVQQGVYKQLRSALPGISLVQVVHVNGESSIQEAQSVAPYIDGLLLDSGNPTLARKELGGTGRVHDWSISRRIREAVAKPVFLAGGLNAQNVREAVRHVAPFGVDVCSGVRTNGKLDEAKLSAFVEQLSVLQKTN